MFIDAKAQSELTLPLMHDIFQSSYINPTVIPEHTISIGLPGMSSIYGQFITNGFRPNSFMDFRNDTMHISPSKFIDELKSQNMINSTNSVDLLHLRLKIRNGYYWIGIRSNMNFSFMYPKELFSLPMDGNLLYIGKNLDFSNLKMDATLYNEYSLGMAKEFNHWVFGARVSLLQGLSNIQFDPKTFNIQIDTTTYEIVGNSNATLNTAGIPMNSANEPSFDHAQDLSYLTNYLTNFKNKGVSLSAGVTYKLNDKLNFSFAFSDLGYINWKDSVTNYTLKGNSTFPLEVISDLISGNEISVDSIFDNFDHDTLNKSYRTYLHPKYLFSASYKIFRRTTVGLTASGVYNKKLYPAYTFGLSQGIGRFFNVLGTISYNQRTIRNLGLGLIIKPGPYQFYIIADNLYPGINPLYTTNANFRVGMNLVFGRVKPSVGLPYR